MSEQGKRSFKIKHTMKASDTLGCYYCLSVFSGVTEIPEWADGGQTPICPMCGIDSVVVYDPKIDGDIENFKRVLAKYNKESFGPSCCSYSGPPFVKCPQCGGRNSI